MAKAEQTCAACGKAFYTYLSPSRLSSGRGRYCSKSCGATGGGHRHGHTTHTEQSPTYVTWSAMRQRCNNPKAHKYYAYGAKGIKVCDRWESFDAFLADMGKRPDGKTIDRIDPNGNYEPSNCRWATISEQQNNLKNVKRILYKGELVTLRDLSRITGIPKGTLVYRVKLKWPEDMLATKPSGKASRFR